MSSKIIKIGNKNSVSYNAKTDRIYPSHRHFVIVTLILIVGPSLLVFGMLYFNDELTFSGRLIMAIVYALSFFICVRSLLKASMTDPGFIPPQVQKLSE